MGLLDMFKGKKRDDNLGLGDMEKDLGADLGLPELGETPPASSMPSMPGQQQDFSMPQETGASSPQSFQDPSLKPEPLDRQVRELPTPGVQETPQQGDSNTLFAVRKEVEVLNSKMDAIKSALESMSQRLINIERMAMYEQEKRKKNW